MSEPTSAPASALSRRTLFWTFGVTGATMALSLVTSILVARNLGPDGRGILLALTFWPALWVGLSNLSLNEATCVLVARAGVAADAERQRSFEASGLLLQLLMSLVTAAIACLVILVMLPEARRDSLDLILWYTVAFAPLSLLDQHFKAILQGRGAFGQLNLGRLAQPVAYLAGLLVLLTSDGYSVAGVLMVMIAALFCSVLVSAFGAGVRVRGATAASLRETLIAGAGFHVANLLLYFANGIDKMLALHFLSVESSGLYAVAAALSMLGAGVVGQSLGVLVTRRMSLASSPGARNDVFVHTLHDAAIMMVLTNGGLALMAAFIVPLLFGPQFAPAVPTVMILLIVGTLQGLRQVVDRTMRALRITSAGMVGDGVHIASALVFASLGATFDGLEGLAWGLALSQGFAFVTTLTLAVRRLEVATARLWPSHPRNLARLERLMRRELEWLRRLGR